MLRAHEEETPIGWGDLQLGSWNYQVLWEKDKPVVKRRTGIWAQDFPKPRRRRRRKAAKL